MLHLSILEVIRNAAAFEAASISAIRSVSQFAAPLVLTALWQGAVVAAGLAICLRFAPHMSAAHRFLVWSAGFAALLSLPLTPVMAHWFGATSGSVSNGLGSASAGHWLQLDIRWAIVITLLWAAGSMLRAADLIIHTMRLFRLWQSATPIDPATAAALLSRVGGGRTVELCTTRYLDRPSVIGFFAPRILIPDWLHDRLTPSEFEQIVLHEAEHLHRRDDWTNLIQKLCLVVFPLNPALTWIEHRLCREREMACDEAVIRATRAPRAYAACLTSLAERGLRRRAEALSLGAWQRRAELVNRVHCILASPRALGPLATRALLGTLGCGLVFGSVEMARCPQLVAFTSDHPDQMAQVEAAGATRSVDVSYSTDALTPSLPAHYRAVNAIARMRINSLAQSRRKQEPHHARHAVALPALAHIAEPSLESLPAPAKTAAASSPRPMRSQEWLVLTTWEQVETSLPPAVSDSVAEQDSGSQIKPTDRSGARVTRQITVTRLMFRVVPVSSFSKRQPGARPVIRDGWLVLQL